MSSIDTSDRTCAPAPYAETPCSGPADHDVVYTSRSGDITERYPTCTRHGQAEIDRFRAAGGDTLVSLVTWEAPPGPDYNPTQQRVVVTDGDGTMIDAWEVDADPSVTNALDAARSAIVAVAEDVRPGLEAR